MRFKSSKHKKEWEDYQLWLNKHKSSFSFKKEPLKLDLGSSPRVIDNSGVVVKSHGMMMSPDGTAKADSKKYTGTSIVGIATMHKSSIVPVFSKEDAMDVSKMRRN